MIVVTGGTSKIGSALLRLLSARGEPVRALARSEASATLLRALGAEPVPGDLGRPASLRAAFSGADRLFLLSSPHPQDPAWHANAIAAAGHAGIGHVVRSSVLGADPASPARMARQHGQSDHLLVRSGLPHTILRPNYFIQNVPEVIVPGIDADGAFYGSAGDARLSMVDTRDIAAAAAAVLTSEGHEGMVHELTGPAALSYTDVGAALAARMGRPVRYVDVPAEAMRQALLGLGMDSWTVGAVVELFDSYRASGTDGWAATTTGTVQALTGRPPRALDDLVRDLPTSAAA